MSTNISKPGDKVTETFFPVDPHMDRKAKKGRATRSITNKSPSPLTIKTATKLKEGSLLTFEEWPGTFDSCYFRCEAEHLVLQAEKVDLR